MTEKLDATGHWPLYRVTNDDVSETYIVEAETMAKAVTAGSRLFRREMRRLDKIAKRDFAPGTPHYDAWSKRIDDNRYEPSSVTWIGTYDDGGDGWLVEESKS